MQRRDIRYQAAVIQDHHVLLIMANDRQTGQDYWLFPGGGREPNETVEQCVQRELREETGLEVHVLGLLFRVPDLTGGIYDWLETYHCTVLSGTAHPGIEPEVDDANYTTIRAIAWIDLRNPTGWEAAILHEPFTFPMLQQVREVLGYTTSSR